MKIVVFLSYYLNRLRVDVTTKLPLFFEKNNAPNVDIVLRGVDRKRSSLNWSNH